MKIVKNYIFNLSYQLFAILIPIITVPYISRTLGPDAIGTNAYTNSVMTYFILLGNVGLSLYGNRTIAYYRNDENELSKKFWEIASLKFIMMIFSFIIFLSFMQFYDKYQTLLLAQSIQLIAIGFDISWFFTGIEDFKKTVTRNVIVKTLSLVLIFMFVKQPEDLFLYIVINSASVLFGNLTLWSYMRRYVHKVKFSALQYRIHLLPVLALFLPQLANNIFMTINRLLLGNLSTLHQTGYFDNADKIVRIFLSFITALGTVVFPRIANSFKEGRKDLVFKYVNYAFNLVNLIAFPIVLGVIIVAKPFSNLFFGPKFEGIDIVLSILVVELIFMGWSSILGQQFLVAINKVRGLTTSMLVSIVVSATGSYLLIPHFGAKAAAGMSVVAEFVIIFVQLLFIRSDLNIFKLYQDVWKYLLSSLVMYVGCLTLRNVFPVGSDLLQIMLLGIIGAAIYLAMIVILKPLIVEEIKVLFLAKLFKKKS